MIDPATVTGVDVEAGSGARAQPSTTRGEETRGRIVDAALRLFEERGFERTTMRAVAGEAGVSLGNAYYYFASKEHLVQAFYDRMQDLHRAASSEALAREVTFAGRLLAVERSWVEIAAPYHPFAGKFFKQAAEPTSPLSPFSPESAPARETTVALFRSVVEGSDAKLDDGLRAELPELLWLAHMGVVLFWVHDRSEGQRRTTALVDRAVPLVDRLVRLSRLRPLRPAVREVLDVVRAVRG